MDVEPRKLYHGRSPIDGFNTARPADPCSELRLLFPQSELEIAYLFEALFGPHTLRIDGVLSYDISIEVVCARILPEQHIGLCRPPHGIGSERTIRVGLYYLFPEKRRRPLLAYSIGTDSFPVERSVDQFPVWKVYTVFSKRITGPYIVFLVDVYLAAQKERLAGQRAFGVGFPELQIEIGRGS